MTGSAGWSYFAATRYILGIRPGYDSLCVDPCIPAAWKGFKAERAWRGAIYEIEVENPHGASKGVAACTLNGKPLTVEAAAAVIPVQATGSKNQIKVIMGESYGNNN
jgi:N,N'-diacetylchitobiose phosphorylase